LALQFSVWVLPSLGATVLAVATAVYLREQRRDPGGTALVLFAMACAVWTGMQVLILSTGDLGLKVLFSQIQYIGITMAPLAWFAFAVAYSGRVAVLRRWGMVIIYAIPVITIGMAFTNGSHGWLWSSMTLVPQSGVVGLEIVHGPWFRVFLGFAYGVVLVGTILLALHIAQSPRHWWRLVYVFMAPASVLLLSVVYLTGNGPSELLDPTPIGFTIAAGLLAWGLMRRGSVDVAPVARTIVVEEMADLVIVVDQHGRMVDLNRAASTTLGLVPDGPVPVELGTRWAGIRGEARIDTDLPISLPLITREGARRIFDMTVTPLGPQGGKDRSVIVLRDVTERERMRRQLQETQQRLEAANLELERRANTDELTGLHSRRSFFESLKLELKRTRRYETPLTLVVLDLDHFKRVNDNYGHPIGDRVLKAAAEAIADACRESDVPGRIGGEEFAILLVETGQEGAEMVAERIRQQIAGVEHLVPGAHLNVTASFGLATACEGRDTADTLVAAADAALYRAKEEGRNRICVASDPGDQTQIDFGG